MVLYCIDDVDDDDQDRDRSIISFRPMYYSVVIVGRSQTSNNHGYVPHSDLNDALIEFHHEQLRLLFRAIAI